MSHFLCTQNMSKNYFCLFMRHYTFMRHSWTPNIVEQWQLRSQVALLLILLTFCVLAWKRVSSALYLSNCKLYNYLLQMYFVNISYKQRFSPATVFQIYIKLHYQSCWTLVWSKLILQKCVPHVPMCTDILLPEVLFTLPSCNLWHIFY